MICDKILRNKEMKLMDNIEIVEVPLTSIGFASSYIDISDDYLYASFIGETLAKISHNITLEMVQGEYHRLTIRFHCVPKNIDEFKDVREKLLDDENSEYHYGSYDPYSVEPVQFPALLDSYFANYLPSLYELETEYVKNELNRHPELKYWFWKSPFGRVLGTDILCSHKIWIIPPETNIEKLFDYLNMGHLKFEKAERLKSNQTDMLFTSNNAVMFDEGEFLNAMQCLGHLSHKQDTWDLQICMPKMNDYHLSEAAETIIGIDSHGYKYLYFAPKKPSEDDLEEYRSGFISATETFDQLMGYTAAISLDWSLLDDSKFEDLCYDVIYYSGQFEVDTIRKMGSSRSRDGGRDIVAWTKASPEQAPTMYIFQCKHTTAKSLSGSKVDVTDTVVQFGAGGYGVMTSTLIDSTLFDKLDGVARTLGIQTITKSKYELERFLEKHSAIKSRYF
jgi:hypothetical protein